MEITNKTILITGASKGIGKAIAEFLADHNVNLILTYNNDSKSMEKVVKIVESKGSNATAIKCDVSSEESVQNLFNEIKKLDVNIDVLINNAGIFDENDSPTNVKAFENVFSVNFLGQVRITSEVLKYMKKGKIVFISSIHGKLGHGRPSAIAYSSMKAALDSYMMNLAKYLAPDILVNSIAPGKTITPQWGEMDKDYIDEQAKDHLTGRWIKPEEVAHAVNFVLENDSLCGQILQIDAGMALKTLN